MRAVLDAGLMKITPVLLEAHAKSDAPVSAITALVRSRGVPFRSLMEKMIDDYIALLDVTLQSGRSACRRENVRLLGHAVKSKLQRATATQAQYDAMKRTFESSLDNLKDSFAWATLHEIFEAAAEVCRTQQQISFDCHDKHKNDVQAFVNLGYTRPFVP